MSPSKRAINLQIAICRRNYAEPSVGKRSLVFGEQSSPAIGFARCGHLSKRFLHAEIFEHLPTLFHGRDVRTVKPLRSKNGLAVRLRFGKNSPEPLSFCLRLDRHQEQTGCANALIIGMDKHHIQVPVGLQIRKSDRYAPTGQARSACLTVVSPRLPLSSIFAQASTWA